MTARLDRAPRHRRARAGAAWWKGRRRRSCSDVLTCSSPASRTITVESNYKTSSELGDDQPRLRRPWLGDLRRRVRERLAPRNLDYREHLLGPLLLQRARCDGSPHGDGRRALQSRDHQAGGQHGRFPGLNATNKYERFNPMVGANYKLLPGLSLYGGYSESNRAPTPAELGCAEPDNPCLIESFLTDDPPLKQVVGRTAEVGLRGQGLYDGGRYTGARACSARSPPTTSCPSRTMAAASSSSMPATPCARASSCQRRTRRASGRSMGPMPSSMRRSTRAPIPTTTASAHFSMRVIACRAFRITASRPASSTG